MSAYWEQWDAAELESWQGIEEQDDTREDDKDIIELSLIDQEDPFTGSLYDFGLSGRDFL